jgi:hypothetical protein
MGRRKTEKRIGRERKAGEKERRKGGGGRERGTEASLTSMTDLSLNR